MGSIVNTLKGGRVDKDNIGLVIQEKVWPEKTRALVARADGSPCIDRGQPFIYDARGNGDGKTANTLTRDHENRITDYTALAVHQNQNGEVRAGKVANTLNTNGNASGRNAPLIVNIFCIATGQANAEILENLSPTLNCNHEQLIACIKKVAPTLDANYHLRCDNQFVKQWGEFMSHYSVRRLTPLECERLQGFPDGWTEYGHGGRKISDSARYRALGNSLAMPCAEFIAGRIKEIYEG
jgi:site-specific DNA-cytosine methylase